MQEVIILVGASGSGKSTWAKEFIEQDNNYIRVNRDAVRMQITGTDSRLLEHHLEKLVSKIIDEQVKTALDNGYSVVLDNTHLKQKYIDEVILKYNHRADIHIRFFTIPANAAKLRVMRRDNNNRLDYIDKQVRQFEGLNKDKTFYPKTTYQPDVKSPVDCIICDLDGTLCLYDDDKNPYDRDFENDRFSENVLMIVNHYIHELNTKVFFFSGRSEKHLNATLTMLTKELDPSYFELYMRKEKDFRRDSVVKEEMFMTHIHNRYNPIMVIDDRLQVIEEVWNKLGIFVLNVNQGNIRF